MQRLFVILTLASCAVALLDDLHLPDNPEYYKEYHRQCRVPLKCAGNRQCPNVYDWKHLERWAQQEALKRFEWELSFQNNPCYLISEKEYDFNLFATGGLRLDEELGVQNTLTTDILLQYLSSQGKCSVRNLLEGHCPNFNRSLSLDKCQPRKAYRCDPNYPYRSYNGICNNLQHPTWGQPGNPLKLEMAPCFDDFVSKRRLSTSGRTLPNNRQLISDIQRAQNSQDTVEPPPIGTFSIFGLIFSEFVTSDMIGRAMKRTRNATTGFRGCRADGSDVSLYRSPLTEPLQVCSLDPNYGSMNVGCLNFSPIENSNDQCDLRYPFKRSIATSYLDLSSTYGEGKYDSKGKLATSFCGASATFGQSHVITIQLLAVAGLFSQLHNFCIDRVRRCGQILSKEEATEKCRTLTIGVYQHIVYEELLLSLFGEEFYSQCNFDCEYDETLESSVSSTYTSALGRFQHIWLPDNFTLVDGNDRVQKPIHEFFLNLETHNCSMALEGTFDDPVLMGSLSASLINKFFSKDGTLGHCLLCLDLERGRDAGLCPLVFYKHYFDKLSGNPTKCYEFFDDLDDIFTEKLIDVFKRHYESPFDIDALFLIFEKEGAPGVNMPKMVAAATCMEFKRLKCSDRFFYTWNKFLSPALEELIHTIDMATLLAMFGGIEYVPLYPWYTHSERMPAEELLMKLENRLHLFCSI